uniref:Uncharacterized protein n=1 Tax=Arundo donax TaxID=35708 RepID=A0A0A8ZN89_ARUDO
MHVLSCNTGRALRGWDARLLEGVKIMLQAACNSMGRHQLPLLLGGPEMRED